MLSKEMSKSKGSEAFHAKVLLLIMCNTRRRSRTKQVSEFGFCSLSLYCLLPYCSWTGIVNIYPHTVTSFSVLKQVLRVGRGGACFAYMRRAV